MNGKENNVDDADDSALDLLEALLDEESVDETSSSLLLIPESANNAGPSVKSSVFKKEVTNIHNGDTDSSDDEDNRFFESQKYNECGKRIKMLINISDINRSSPVGSYPLKEDNLSWKSKVNSPVPLKVPKTVQKVDVYSDPVFGIRMINPLITSRELQERMVGRKAVTMASVKCHIANGGAESDWVIAGVVVQKSAIRTSQKGSQYCIWKISDLKGNLKTVSVFFFRNSYKNLWKTSLGTVVGILNPKVMDDSKDSDEATLAVDNAQKVMIMGVSKDYGTCQAKKKNGDQCIAFINKNACTYCIYHVQQEYKKCSRRSDLQGPCLGRGLNALRNKVLGKNEVFYAGQSFSAIPTSVSRKQAAKDEMKLRQLTKPKLLTQSKLCSALNNQGINLLRTTKDKDILNILGQTQTSSSVDVKSSSVLTAQPKMSDSAVIDLSSPINKVMKNRAKVTALEWIKRNGKLDKCDPNAIRNKDTCKRKTACSPPEDRAAKVVKMATGKESDPRESEPKPKNMLPSAFMELLALKSKHTNLIEAGEQEAQEEYFSLLEKKEKLEEKMLTTYKVPCKAVKCLKCKYTAFSASDLCKKEHHPLKVTDAVKRFFSCKNCGNRTAILELIPLLSCKQCGEGQWERAPMLKERKGSNLQVQQLSIRGGEEKFLGSVVNDCNLDLMVPE